MLTWTCHDCGRENYHRREIDDIVAVTLDCQSCDAGELKIRVERN